MDELELAANELLKKSGVINSGQGVKCNNKSGIYTEDQLIDHNRREIGGGLLAAGEPVADCDITELQLAEILEFSRMVKFTDKQRSVWIMWVGGLSESEIAHYLDCSRQNIYSIIKTCRRKFLCSYKHCPYYGWYEVYLSEVHRYPPKKKFIIIIDKRPCE
jgi:DNA-binding CsgD family transcriptional regulator